MTNLKNALSKEISRIAKPTYFWSIPLDEMFAAVRNFGGLVVDEAGEEWSGFFCGEQGSATLKITGIKTVHGLVISWYKMPSGKLEVIAYIG